MSEERTLWEKEIEAAEFGYPNNHFYNDVRYLTTIISDLLNVIDSSVGMSAISEETSDYIAWYLATETEEKAVQKAANPTKLCDCNKKILLNQGCQCGGA